MISNAKNLIILAMLLLSVSSFYIMPLRAGTIKVTDKQLRSTKKIEKMIDLKLDKQYYQAHKDIKVIASITSLAIDQYINFYFLYDIVCPEQQCFLNFTLLVRTTVMKENMVYSIHADYLVARGLQILNLNMTEYQSHLQLRHIRSYNQNNQEQQIVTIPHNNADAWHMLMFPSGFSNVSLSGKVIYNYVNDDMYIVHYNNMDVAHGEHDHMGWVEDINNILYRVVFVPDSYLNSDCQPSDKSHLSYHYKLNCNGKDKVKWFYGFKSTGQLEIQGQFFDLKSGFSFSLAKSPSDYGVVAFPFESSQQFIDERIHEYKWDVQKQQIKKLLGWILIFALVIASGVAVKYTQERLKKKKFFEHIQRKTSDESIQSQKLEQKSLEI